MTVEAYSIARTFEPAPPQVFETDRHYLLYALDGLLRLEAQGRRWTLPPARAALIHAGRPLTITVVSRLSSASVLFAPGFMAPPPQALAVFDMSPLARELVSACRRWTSPSEPLTLEASRLFAALAEVALRLAASPTPCVLPVPSSAALARAMALTEAQAAAEPSFEAIARDTGQSPRALARRFADELGMTWREALRRIRITRAVEALALGEDSVTQVALAVGYSSISAFNAAFRDLMGVSPSAYRASLQDPR